MTLNRRQLFRLVGAGAALSSLGTTAAVAAQPRGRSQQSPNDSGSVCVHLDQRFGCLPGGQHAGQAQAV